MKHPALIPASLTILLGMNLQGCLPQQNIATPAPPAAKQGQFIDTYVSNIYYSATPSGKTGHTDKFGFFNYSAGDTVTFSIGAIHLPPIVPTSNTVTPYDLAGSGNNGVANNIGVLLQTLDEDGNPENGIQLTELAQNEANNVNGVDVTNLGSFRSSLANALDTKFSQKDSSDMKTDAEAKSHMDNTIANQFVINEFRRPLENIYVDTNGNGVQETTPYEPTTGLTHDTKAANLTLVKDTFTEADLENKKFAMMIFVTDHFTINDATEGSLRIASIWYDLDSFLQYYTDNTYQYGSFLQGLFPIVNTTWSINTDGSLGMMEESTYDQTYIKVTKVSGLPDRDNAMLYEVWFDFDIINTPDISTIITTQKPDWRVLGDLKEVTDPRIYLSNATLLSGQSVNKDEPKYYRLSQTDIDACVAPNTLTFNVIPATPSDNPRVRVLPGDLEWHLMRLDLPATAGGCEGNENHINCLSGWSWWPANFYTNESAAGITETATIDFATEELTYTNIVVQGNNITGPTNFSIEASCTSTPP